LEALKGFGIGKKTTKVARHLNELSQDEGKKVDVATDLTDKENYGVSYNVGAGLGGISYTVQ
jgi:hypothetical protein